ncbi:MAG: hypothetical protein ACFFAS_19825 [Promethearchaeota archaeon]
MKIKYGSMIFYGTLKAIFYLVLPLVVMGILESNNLMQISDDWKIGIIVLGVIGTVLAVITHMFEKNTVAHGYTKIIDSTYSAIFIVYMFGGFTPGVKFGTFTITYEQIVASVGIQIFAYLFLIGALFSVMRHILRTIEIYKDKQYKITKFKRAFQASRIFQVAGIITSLLIFGYFVSIPLSAINVDIGFLSSTGFSFSHNDGGTPFPNYTDDSIEMSIPFYVDNQGVYSILNIEIDVNIYVRDCTNVTGYGLPDGYIGGTPLDNVWNFYQFSYAEESFNITISGETTMAGLALENATLDFEFYLAGRYAGIDVEVDLGVLFSQPWENLTYIP